MTDVTWLGDEDPSIQSIEQFGYTFVKGQPVAVPEKDKSLEKFKGNAFFSIGKKGDVIESEKEEIEEPEDPEVTAVKADLDTLGVTYRKNASLETLRHALAEATAP